MRKALPILILSGTNSLVTFSEIHSRFFKQPTLMVFNWLPFTVYWCQLVQRQSESVDKAVNFPSSKIPVERRYLHLVNRYASQSLNLRAKGAANRNSILLVDRVRHRLLKMPFTGDAPSSLLTCKPKLTQAASYLIAVPRTSPTLPPVL